MFNLLVAVQGDGFCWLVDVTSNILAVYGMRKAFLKCFYLNELASRYRINAVQKEKLLVSIEASSDIRLQIEALLLACMIDTSVV